ncbi:hypothetical protein OH76DRAFT_1459627 [Lentinus brumalis]|uniref:Uncharacterized protein n=1 Tax=Lentinus brumalis TaxID=2498619 RepID=A0A371CI03_9APHY|nr:hypothetical protein OH76DRAFT_1459627 [Polyporus brumalis]
MAPSLSRAACAGEEGRPSSSYTTTSTSAAGASSSRCPRSSLAGSTGPSTVGDTWRDVCRQIVSEQYPWFAPRNDFDIFTLAMTKYRGSREELGTWLDAKLASAIGRQGSMETVMGRVRSALNQPSNTITGLKPRRMDRNVFLRPIPQSSYSIRLFPGCFDAREYCLDFVDTRTGVAVNSPFKFELWVIPDPSTPWLGSGSTRITSLEKVFGYLEHDIPPGHKTFVVRDGQTCLLKRPGRRDVRVTVPVCIQPAAAATGADNAYVLTLPASVVA